MRTKLQDAISRRNFLKGSSTAVAAAALPAGMVRSLPADAADASNPFPHGIASGDPLSDSVMLWTRLNPDFVEANAAPGQAEIRTKPKPRCKGCKVKQAQTGNNRARCKGCQVKRSDETRAAVQSAKLVLQVVGPLASDAIDVLNEANAENSHAQFEINPAQEFSLTALFENDYTVRQDVTGLQPGSYYYYRFVFGQTTSPIGRTKTLPAENTAAALLSAKIALVSCSSIPHGYFNAYGALAGLGSQNDFDDVDVVLCLGDYIYEYADRCYPDGDPVRTDPLEPAQPLTEIVSLNDYRARHRQYKMDPELQALHRKFPMINVWDDHETTDNSYPNGANNHTPGGPDSGPTDPNDDLDAWKSYHCNQGGGGRQEGDWPTRLNAGQRAYFEYLPVRPDPSDPFLLYRKFKFGKLADLLMLDTRLLREGPDSAKGTTQDGAEATGPEDTNITEPTRYLLGRAQQQWLSEQMDASTATWQLLGQQIMVGQLRIVPADLLGGLPVPVEELELPGIPGQSIKDSEGVIYITDIWDGWQASRERLYDVIKAKNEAGGNVVILTGDIHTSWANDIHPNPADASGCIKTIVEDVEIYKAEEGGYCQATGEGSLAVEFVCPSITSHGLPELEPVQDLIRSVNPHIQFIDLAKHGFVILDVTETQVTGTWHFVGKDAAVSQRDPDYKITSTIAFTCDAGKHYLNESCAPAPVTDPAGACPAEPQDRPDPPPSIPS